MKALHTEAGSRATRREWIGLAVLALPTLLLSMDISVLYLALPQLSTDLAANSTEQLWILDIYSFLLAGFLVTMGTLGDRIGRRRLLLIGATAFSVASVMAAYAQTAEMLIGSRALLGVAGATLMPSTMALIRNMFTDPRQMSQAIGIWFACFMGGMTIGPLAGGALLEWFWWGSAFLLGIPFMLLLLVLGPVLLPEHRDPHAGRLDLPSVLLSLAAILPVIYGVKSLARSGANGGALLAIVAGLVIAMIFLQRQRQRRLAHPLLDLQLFRTGVFSTALSTMWFTGVVMAGISLASALYLQLVQGFPPLTAGLWLIPQNIAMVIGLLGASRLAQRFRASRLMATGLLISASGFVALAFVPADGGLPVLITGLLLVSLGMGLPMSLTGSMILGSAPPEKAGSAAAVMETSGEFGVAVGVATLGSLTTFIYREQVSDAIPANATAEVAGAVRESLAMAVGVAQQMGGQLGTELLQQARAAFAAGLNTISAIGALIYVVLAVLCLLVLRKADAPARPEEEAAGVSTTTGPAPAAPAGINQ